jgi:hypothetical protein
MTFEIGCEDHGVAAAHEGKLVHEGHVLLTGSPNEPEMDFIRAASRVGVSCGLFAALKGKVVNGPMDSATTQLIPAVGLGEALGVLAQGSAADPRCTWRGAHATK